MTMQQIDVEKRLDTGPLKVGKDWPGVFIRGDEAIALAQGLAYVARLHKDDATQAVCKDLTRLFMSCFTNEQ